MTLLLLFCESLGATVTVASAANVSYALEELCEDFEKGSGVDVRVVVGSSGKLTAQIERGAPFDLFLSADMSYPVRLWKRGFAVSRPRVYAGGSLVVWSLKGADISGGVRSLQDGSIGRIAIASVKSAPYGRAAERALKAAGVYEKVKSRLVYAESVSQTNRYIVSKVVDAGITAKSVVMSPKMAGKGEYVDVDPSLYTPIEQGIVILKHAESGSMEDARRFYNYIFSDRAKAILKKYGYIVE